MIASIRASLAGESEVGAIRAADDQQAGETEAHHHSGWASCQGKDIPLQQADVLPQLVTPPPPLYYCLFPFKSPTEMVAYE
jgi:hypothetical protein